MKRIILFFHFIVLYVWCMWQFLIKQFKDSGLYHLILNPTFKKIFPVQNIRQANLFEQ